MKLKQYGASERFLQEATLYPEWHLARIVSQSKDLYSIVTEQGEGLAEVSGKFRHAAHAPSDYPAVGDFVMVDRSDMRSGHAIIHQVLTRTSAFERAAVGAANETQVIAANIDIVFVCMALNNDYNLSRLERYLSVVWSSGATPVVVLTKSDLCTDLPARLPEVEVVAIGVDIIVTAQDNKSSYAALRGYLQPGVTASFVGSSGVGKSTLINLLAGHALVATSATRQDGKGRHTTTRRELAVLNQGGIVIDTPGMRELGAESVDLSKSFADIDVLVSQCKFNDCTHTNEPGCAVQAAIQDGTLDERRLANYRKLQLEASYDGLSSREIEAEKLSRMFSQMGGMKNARSYIRANDKRH